MPTPNDPITPTELGEMLRLARERAGLTPTEASTLAGISYERLRLWEHGQSVYQAVSVLSQFELYGCILTWQSTNIKDRALT